MRRGDVVTVVAPSDYGKARPAIVVQADHLLGTDSVIVCPLTSFRRDAPLFRLSVPAGAETGLRQDSQIMVDKVTALHRGRIGSTVGHLDDRTMVVLGQMLASCLGLAGGAA